MKKFLFTLAALLMVGSLSAEEYFYMDNFEVPQSALGASGAAGRINVDVKAHYDYYVSAWQVNFTLPEGLTIAGHRAGSDLTLSGYDDFGDPKTFTPNLKVSQEKDVVIVACDEADYDADGEGIMYGCMKWAPGDYDQMWIVVFNATEDFQGGEVIIETQPACGSDIRPEIEGCPKGQDNFHTAIVTVEGAVQPLQDLTGQIVVGEVTEDGLVAISYDGTEDVTITVNGEEYTEPIQLVEGENTLVIVVSADGYNDLTETVTLTWNPVPPVVVTETPTFDWDPETFTITAIGAGEVLMYVDGEPVSNPFTFEQGEVEMTYTVTATAQEPGKEISEIATMIVTVPAAQVVPPVDPDDHNVGYWLVMLDKDMNPVWYKLTEGDNGDYTTTVALTYDIFGRYNHDTGYRGDVPFYFMVDGVRYGAEEAEVETNLGQALMNPLTAAEGYYTVAVGYNYTLGIAFETEGDGMFVYAAQAGFTGVDELMNGKTVAGVRYFNMAGQEMTEANGMTIVVTTYPDGTTSAFKVMK